MLLRLGDFPRTARASRYAYAPLRGLAFTLPGQCGRRRRKQREIDMRMGRRTKGDEMLLRLGDFSLYGRDSRNLKMVEVDDFYTRCSSPCWVGRRVGPQNKTTNAVRERSGGAMASVRIGRQRTVSTRGVE